MSERRLPAHTFPPVRSRGGQRSADATDANRDAAAEPAVGMGANEGLGYRTKEKPMSTCHPIPHEGGEEPRPYREAELYQLLAGIAHRQDPVALRELVSFRTHFAYGQRRDLRLLECIRLLWTDRVARARVKSALRWDRALDLTCDRFTNLPCPAMPAAKVGDECAKLDDGEDGGDDTPVSRVDCAKTYAAILRRLDANAAFTLCRSSIERDQRVAVDVQRSISHHLNLTFREAGRYGNPFISRYTWSVDGKGKLTLWLPKYFAGKERAAWLRAAIPDADPRRPGERARVQATIDKRLAMPRLESMADCSEADRTDPHRRPDAQAEFALRGSFAAFLSREKADAVDQQRPAIRALGAQRLERLCLTVMENWVTGEYTDRQIAGMFDLSPTSMSHFAGSRWNEAKSLEGAEIPDLYRNAARLLSTCEAFRDLAAQAGVLGPSVAIDRQADKVRLRERDDAR